VLDQPDPSRDDAAMTGPSAAVRPARRPDAVDLALIVLLGIGVVTLVALGRGLTFFADEWAVIGDRPIGLDTFLRPFNEHWLGVMTLVHRAMVETIGIGSYVPYLALLAALHAIVVAEVYLLARRWTWPVVALGIAVIVTFFGSGFENLFWAMQIGFIGSIALGFGALLVLDRSTDLLHAAASATLLTIGVMTSGFGLFMLALVGLDAVLDRRRWGIVPWLVIPAGTYLAWYLTLGRTGLATYGDPFTTENLLAVPMFVIDGLAEAMSSAFGVGRIGGLLVLVALVSIIVVRLLRRQPIPSRALACFGAIVVMYALLGLVRVGIDPQAAAYSRYSYLSGMLALLGWAVLIGRPALPTAPNRRLLVIAGAAILFVLSLTWNGRLLLAGRSLFAERADLTRAMVELGVSEPLPDGVRPDLSLVLVPSPVKLHAIVERYGSPLTDSLAGDAVPPISAGAREEALGRATNPPDWLLDQPWLP
jgi:hypothetical protein